jgi:GAF domain-containing protein
VTTEAAGAASKLSSGLRELAGVLHRDHSADAVLQLVTELAAQTLTGAHGVSISLKAGGGYTTASALPASLVPIDESQYDPSRGPCVEALERNQCIEGNLRDCCERWPEFVSAARAGGYEFVMSVPLSSDVTDAVSGALNVYSRDVDPFDSEQRRAATAFAHSAGAALNNAEAFKRAALENEHLNLALHSRGLIGEAKGIIMERTGCSSDDAFDELRRLSQSTNRKVVVIAHEIVQSAQRARDDGRNGDG